MRNSTVAVLGLAFLMTMPVAAHQTSPFKLMKDVKARVQAMSGQSDMPDSPVGKRLAHKVKVSELAGKLKWSKVKTFGWDGEEWMPDENIQYSYDAAGNIILETSEDAYGMFTRVESSYANGMCVSELTKISEDGVNFENNKKVEIEYDHILTNVITRHLEWLWDGEWLQNGNNYERRITRDGAGNVTETVIAVLYDGIFDPTQRLIVTYGADGKATEIAEEILDYDGKDFFWVAGDKITDIVWDITDGQIVDMDNIFSGNNRIKSGQMVDSDGMIFDLNVDYAAAGDAYSMTMTTNLNGMSMVTTSEYTPLDNGGYLVVTKATFLGQILISMTQEGHLDEWGLLTLEQLSQEGMEGNYVEGTKGIVEYDAEGKPMSYTVITYSEDSESGESESEYVLRAEFSDYVDVTSGVSTVETEAVSPRYYNLQGMPVSAPQKGTIVICNGKKTVF